MCQRPQLSRIVLRALHASCGRGIPKTLGKIMTSKIFKIPGDQIKQVAPGRGACIASDHIVVEGKKVGFMYREAPTDATDSGWRFFSGEEDQDYIDDSEYLGFYDVNTIANYDPAIIPCLGAAIRSQFGRVSGTDKFKKEEFNPPEE
jgi:hypothetical protein